MAPRRMPFPGRLPHLHQAPVVRLSRCLSTFTFTGPVRASGLVSNAFRRNAAHTSGLHATPASFFTLSRRGAKQFRPRFRVFRLWLELPDSTPPRIDTETIPRLPVFQPALGGSLVCPQPRGLCSTISGRGGYLVPLSGCQPASGPPGCRRFPSFRALLRQHLRNCGASLVWHDPAPFYHLPMARPGRFRSRLVTTSPLTWWNGHLESGATSLSLAGVAGTAEWSVARCGRAPSCPSLAVYRVTPAALHPHGSKNSQGGRADDQPGGRFRFSTNPYSFDPSGRGE